MYCMLYLFFLKPFFFYFISFFFIPAKPRINSLIGLKINILENFNKYFQKINREPFLQTKAENKQCETVSAT